MIDEVTVLFFTYLRMNLSMGSNIYAKTNPMMIAIAIGLINRNVKKRITTTKAIDTSCLMDFSVSMIFDGDWII